MFVIPASNLLIYSVCLHPILLPYDQVHENKRPGIGWLNEET